jgi:crotonobetainyl-CoA:carnitine CoA-transferase CaiB-like acyl-CoA transferase
MADRTVGISAVGAILAALWHRERTGEGQSVDIPMFETLTQFVLGDHMGGSSFTPPEGAPGYPRLLTKDRRPYQTKDGYICALIYTDGHWRRFFAAVPGWAHFADDPRFATLASRLRHIAEIYPMVAEFMRQHTTDECIALLDRLDIPVMRLNTVESLIDDPHLKAKGFFRAVEHPSEGPILQMAVPTQYSKTPAGPERLAPRLGEHSREVLRDAGYDDAAIDALVAARVTLDAAAAAKGG